MNERIVTDAIVLLDGANKPFFSYVPYEIAQEIQSGGGLSCANNLTLRETDDRPIPDCVKDGTANITDVLIRLDAGKEYNLN